MWFYRLWYASFHIALIYSFQLLMCCQCYNVTARHCVTVSIVSLTFIFPFTVKFNPPSPAYQMKSEELLCEVLLLYIKQQLGQPISMGRAKVPIYLDSLVAAMWMKVNFSSHFVAPPTASTTWQPLFWLCPLRYVKHLKGAHGPKAIGDPCFSVEHLMINLFIPLNANSLFESVNCCPEVKGEMLR